MDTSPTGGGHAEESVAAAPMTAMGMEIARLRKEAAEAKKKMEEMEEEMERLKQENIGLKQNVQIEPP